MLCLLPSAGAQLSGEDLPGASPEKDFVYGAWLPYWGMKEGKKSLERNKSLNALSPVWFEVRADGSLETRIKSSAGFLKETARRRGLKLTPSLAIFDYKHLENIIGNPANRKRHVDAILTEVRSPGFDGIDIDYEAIGIGNKEDYFLFLESLSKGLREMKKTLSVTVLSKWGDEIDYSFLPQTHEVQDWTRIGRLADEVRIMAYDFTLPKSTYPGPIAPSSWVEEILKYAITKIPRKKIILGVHLYGYEWRSADERNLVLKTNPNENPLGEKRATSLTHDLIQGVLRKNTGKLERRNGEEVFRYSIPEKSRAVEHRVLIFPGRAGVMEKVTLAREYEVGGVYFWRLGGEEDLLLIEPVAVYRTKP